MTTPKSAEELAEAYTYPNWLNKSGDGIPEKYAGLMSYEIAELIKEAYLAGHAAGHAKADELLSYLPKVPTQPYEKELAQQLAAERARSSRLVDVLSNVRSQMCWDRDRDQLSMGMRDVHSSVTETLAEYEGGK